MQSTIALYKFNGPERGRMQGTLRPLNIGVASGPERSLRPIRKEVGNLRTTEACHIPSESLLRIMEELYAKLPRNRLQQALSDAKLLPKREERARMREVCAHSEKWTEFVLEMLRSPASDNTHRLLGTLAESYVRAATPVVRSAFEEARRAAERSDGKRFFAENRKDQSGR
jgi:hypothetical protein